MKLVFIGTGNMGKPMAANLVKGGHDVRVYDANGAVAQSVARDIGARPVAGLQSGDPFATVLHQRNYSCMRLRRSTNKVNSGADLSAGHFRHAIGAFDSHPYKILLFLVGTIRAVHECEYETQPPGRIEDRRSDRGIARQRHTG